jgi:DNA-directed RNA polymerase subunit A'
MSDGTVRNTANNIIQFSYGDDGIDPTKSVQGNAVDFDKVVSNVLGFESEDTVYIEAFDKSEHFGYGEREIEIAEPDLEAEDMDDGDDI